MNDHLPPSFERDALDELEKDFYYNYGRTLAAWARFEQELCRLFCALCWFDSDKPLGPALFFSGRSFNTRSALISAANRSSGLTEHAQEVIRALLKKARQFETARNQIAHGYPAHQIHEGVPWQGWRIKEGDEATKPGGIGRDDLRNATENFYDLALFTGKCIAVIGADRQGYQYPHADSLELIRALPPSALERSSFRTDEAP